MIHRLTNRWSTGSEIHDPQARKSMIHTLTNPDPHAQKSMIHGLTNRWSTGTEIGDPQPHKAVLHNHTNPWSIPSEIPDPRPNQSMIDRLRNPWSAGPEINDRNSHKSRSRRALSRAEFSGIGVSQSPLHEFPSHGIQSLSQKIQISHASGNQFCLECRRVDLADSPSHCLSRRSILARSPTYSRCPYFWRNCRDSMPWMFEESLRQAVRDANLLCRKDNFSFPLHFFLFTINDIFARITCPNFPLVSHSLLGYGVRIDSSWIFGILTLIWSFIRTLWEKRISHEIDDDWMRPISWWRRMFRQFGDKYPCAVISRRHACYISAQPANPCCTCARRDRQKSMGRNPLDFHGTGQGFGALSLIGPIERHWSIYHGLVEQEPPFEVRSRCLADSSRLSIREMDRVGRGELSEGLEWADSIPALPRALNRLPFCWTSRFFPCFWIPRVRPGQNSLIDAFHRSGAAKEDADDSPLQISAWTESVDVKTSIPVGESISCISALVPSSLNESNLIEKMKM
jgi:hypothetical protein